MKKTKNILWFEEVNKKDLLLVGGKNGSLGEMFSELSQKGVNIPDGFALTTKAYWYFIKENNLEKELDKIFSDFNPDSLVSLQKTGKKAREAVNKGKIPNDLAQEIISAYQKLSKKYKQANTEVAVRSSGVAEDAPTDSFAGQFETFLNVSGNEKLLEAIKKCIASSFNDRVIAYREEKKMSHMEFALSIGVQKMVRSDLASSGIMFTLDTETGFSDVVLVNSIWGIGEMIVQGKITPDEFYVHKPTLKKGYKSIIVKNLGLKNKKYVYAPKGGLKEVKVSEKKQLVFSIEEEDILKLSKWAVLIEDHYKMAQDIEWAKDGKTGELFIVQSRPETVHTAKNNKIYKEYEVRSNTSPILTGTAIGDKVGYGKVNIIFDVKNICQFKKGDILVTKMTDPDWVPAMRIASAIVTDEGGKTCHAAIIARELGVPAIVGTHKATKILKKNQSITVDCTQGLNGKIFKGNIPLKVKEYSLEGVSDLKSKIMINIAAPEIAFKTSFLPNSGVGLAREEFIIAEKIKVHPLALYHFDKLKDKKVKKQIAEITIEHKDKKDYFVKELAEGIAQIAAAFYPKKVIVRFSDFKTNEYAQLIGGSFFEPADESNPMLGWRGAARYYDEKFKPAFLMECEAIKRVRDLFGLNNVEVMVPFCRTVEEGKKVLKIIKKSGLGKDLKIHVMCEIPSNVVLAEEFLKIFDGFSIGSNDLTQLALGMDRDNAYISGISDERDETVKKMIKDVIKHCKKKKKYCGICGQAPSDYPEFAKFLIKEGIESISLSPDAVTKTLLKISKEINKKNV